MAEHTLLLSLPDVSVEKKDITVVVKSDGAVLGTLLISKGAIEWRPRSKSVKKRKVSWENFAEMMSIKKKKPVKKRAASAKKT